MTRGSVVAMLSVAGMSLAAPLAAQGTPVWGPPVGTRVVSLDVARPSWDGVDLAAASGLLYAGLRVPVTASLSVVGELPYARFEESGVAGSALGNVYLGIEHAAAGPSGMVADLGLRLPTVNESGDIGGAAALAAFSDFDRAEAWLDEVWAARGHVGYRHWSPGGFMAGFAFGATLWASGQSEDEVLADYRAHAGFRRDNLALGAEFTGRAILTADGGSFGERTLHQLTLGAGMAAGPVWPRLSLRIPLDADLKDFGLNHVFGLAIDWRF